MKNWQLYLLNAFLLFIVGYNILPDFTLNKNEFNRVSGTLYYAKTETFKEKRYKKLIFNNVVRERLIIGLADRIPHEYLISDIYKKHWPKLLDANAIGKEVVLYLGAGDQKEDPFRLELDSKVIFDTDVRFMRNILIIAFTLIFTVFNLYRYFDSNIMTSFRKMKNKMLGTKDFFLD